MLDLRKKGENKVEANEVQTTGKVEVDEKELTLNELEKVSGGGVLRDVKKVEPTDI